MRARAITLLKSAERCASLQPWRSYLSHFIGKLELNPMTPGHPTRTVAIVAIGRNEGERLKSCLRAAMAGARTVVYVDSGSTDGSAEYARWWAATWWR